MDIHIYVHIDFTKNVSPEFQQAIQTLADAAVAMARKKGVQDASLAIQTESAPQIEPAPVTQTPEASPIPTSPPAAVPTAAPAASAVPTAVPTAPAAPSAPAAPTTPNAPAQAPAPAAVPTAQQTYTLDQLAVAATQLVDAGRREELVQLLASFGVQALTALPKEQYGAFATKLREMGAKI